MMNIALDARKYNDFGIGTYIRNLAAGFDAHGEHRFTYVVSPGDAASVGRAHRGRVLTNTSGKYSLRELVSISAQANRAGLDVFHAPHYTLPLGLSMRSVVTIHDVIHLKFPEYFTTLQRGYARLMIAHAAKASDAVIVDSEFAGRELLRSVSVPREKLHVIPLGVSGAYRPDPTGESVERFRRVYGISGPFLLYVGSLKPYKNVGLLITALAHAGREDVRLVCVGENVGADRDLAALTVRAGMQQRVVSLGWLPEDDVVAAYRAAAALVLPSLYEGFGLPVLEAMACGTPVISSHAASLPEVGGDAAISISPESEKELADAIRAVLDDRGLCAALREKGLRRAAEFTWQRCADTTLDVYRALT